MKKNIFIFSSPLHYMFANIIANTLLARDENRAYFYICMKDFSGVFDAIDQVLGYSLRRDPLDSLNPQACDKLLLTSRYDAFERDVFYKFRGLYKDLCLYEEGLNFYLPHFYYDGPALSDGNLKLLSKNILRRMLNKKTSHLYMRQFDEVYSIFKDIPYMRKKTRWISVRNQIESLGVNSVRGAKECIFLSQWFVCDGRLDAASYLEYVERALKLIAQRCDVVYYKPHPRDPDGLAAHVWARGLAKRLYTPYDIIPVELYLAKNPGTDLYGFWTSAMFYAKALFNVNTYSLLKDISITFSSNRKIRQDYEAAKPLLQRFGIEELSLKA